MGFKEWLRSKMLSRPEHVEDNYQTGTQGTAKKLELILILCASLSFLPTSFTSFHLLLFLGDTLIVFHDHMCIHSSHALCSRRKWPFSHWKWEVGEWGVKSLQQCPSIWIIFGCFGFSFAVPLIDVSYSFNSPMEWFPKISSQNIFHLKFSNPQKCLQHFWWPCI